MGRDLVISVGVHKVDEQLGPRRAVLPADIPAHTQPHRIADRIEHIEERPAGRELHVVLRRQIRRQVDGPHARHRSAEGIAGKGRGRPSVSPRFCSWPFTKTLGLASGGPNSGSVLGPVTYWFTSALQAAEGQRVTRLPSWFACCRIVRSDR